MRAITMTLTTLALGAVLMLGQTARADEVRETVDANGIRWRWMPKTFVVEKREVTIPGHYETRLQTIQDAGHFETRERRVWVPATVVYEQRAHSAPAVVINRHGVRVSTGHAVQTVAVQRPGYWKNVCEQVWVAGCTRTVQQQVWVAERTECRSVTVEKPGYWVRLACEEPRGVRVTVRLGR